MPKNCYLDPLNVISKILRDNLSPILNGKQFEFDFKLYNAPNLLFFTYVKVEPILMSYSTHITFGANHLYLVWPKATHVKLWSHWRDPNLV